MLLKNKRILIVSPHPDDEAIGSGGLIMRAKKEGAKVFVLYIATGQSRQFMNGVTLESVRVAELEKASLFGGFESKVAFTGVSTKVDSLLQKQIIEAVEDTTKDFVPDIVVIPYRKSYNQDHRAVATACITAFRPMPKNLHPQPEMILESEEPYVWSQAGAFTPNFYVDISDFIEEKMDLYRCHGTQVTEDPSPRSINNLRRLAGFRGCEISVGYAEGYNLIKGRL